MLPYPHPAKNLAIFKQRLATDLGQDPTTFNLTVSAPTPIATVLASLGACADRYAAYNTLVDMEASGGLLGEVDRYPYDRLSLAELGTVLAVQGIDVTQPFLQGSAATLQDLLPAINTRWGTTLDPTDLVATAIPSCECVGPGGIGVALEANPLSLLYTGQLTVYVVPSQPLLAALQQPYLTSLGLPIPPYDLSEALQAPYPF